MLVKEIEQALALAVKNGWQEGNDTISRHAFIHLMRRLPQSSGECFILQLGRGQSALLWDAVIRLKLLPLTVMIVEHHPIRSSQLFKTIASMSGVKGFSHSLKQLSDDEWETLFRRPAESASLWGGMGRMLSLDQYEQYTVRNAFYGEAHRLPLAEQSVDALLVGGPHGNGRSIAFPLFHSKLKPDALIWINEHDHYPFADDLRRIYACEDIHCDNWEEPRWQLLRLRGTDIAAD